MVSHDKARLLEEIAGLFAILKKEFGNYRMPVVDLIEAQTGDPFHVLVSTILSARTQDGTTADASRRLYAIVNTPEDLEKLTVKEIEKLIFPVGFFRNKARFLKKLPQQLNELFHGRIPDSVEELIKLPGVGRKTANLVVAIGFHKPAICVDVHVHRIFNRLGYMITKTPFETEMTLREILPKKYWLMINSYVVSFGQHTCRPINPHCDICPIYNFCKRVDVITKRPLP